MATALRKLLNGEHGSASEPVEFAIGLNARVMGFAGACVIDPGEDVDDWSDDRIDRVVALDRFWNGGGDIEGLRPLVENLGEIDARAINSIPIGVDPDGEDGEIEVRGPWVISGYYHDADPGKMTDDGWLMTGDVGEWVDGTHVRIVDRIKHIIITSGGKNISPSEIENSLKTSPYVKEAMVIGEGRKYLTALIGIELDTVGDWALRHNITYTTYRDLSEKPEVIELIQGVVDRTNEKFARVENIRKFALLPKELDHEDGELTATQKLKRSAMMDLFGDLVESMY